MGPVEILVAGVVVVLCIFAGWLVWQAFLWLVHSGVLDALVGVIGGILAMIVYGGCLLIVGAVVLALIVGAFQSIFGG